MQNEMGIPGGSVVKNPPVNTEDMGSIPGLGRSTGEGNDNSFQYSCLENSMERGAWWTIDYRVEIVTCVVYAFLLLSSSPQYASTSLFSHSPI